MLHDDESIIVILRRQNSTLRRVNSILRRVIIQRQEYSDSLFLELVGLLEQNELKKSFFVQN